MKRKLFGYMFILTVILLLLLAAGFYMFDSFDSTQKNTYDSLDMQMEIFEKEVTYHFDQLAASGIRISEYASGLISDSLGAWGISFRELDNSKEHLEELQRRLIPELTQQLLRMEASGVFVMLDATVNTELSDYASSRSGVYLQVNGYGSTDSTMVMYRGASNVGKELGIVPHRKWQLEFHTEDFPDYEAILSRIGKPLHEAYGMTPLFTLRGTSEKTVLMTVPIYGPDGHFWGICGYEMRQSYFMSSRAQTSKLPRLICLMAPKVSDSLEAGMGLGCGVKSGYYPEPDGSLAMRSFGGGLLLLSGNGQKYIGYTHDVTISPNNDAYTLAVMIPKADYDREFNRALLKNVLIWVALIVAAGNCCLIFSRHYLKPILKGLEALKSADRGESVSSVPEIQDLFRFLAEQDRQNEKTKVELEREMLDARDEVRRLHLEYEQTKSAYLQAEENYSKAQREIERIERSGKAEVDPEDYQMFLEGLKTLTPTEKKIYQHYLDGKTVKEIVVLSDIKESTLRFHNKNIYSKLGVHSLKQLLQYAELSENPQ